MTPEKPTWTGSRNARWVLARCWDLGLRPPAGHYTLTRQWGQDVVLNLVGAAKTPLTVEHETYGLWAVEASVGMATLRHYWSEGALQATQRHHSSARHKIGHWMSGFNGVPLLHPDAFIWRMTCPHCGAKITRAPMPKDEHDFVDPLPIHTDPVCERWRGRHE